MLMLDKIKEMKIMVQQMTTTTKKTAVANDGVQPNQDLIHNMMLWYYSHHSNIFSTLYFLILHCLDSVLINNFDQVGKKVILYALLRFDQPVAKGTIVSIRPNTIVGGQALGREFCEVIITSVLKRDAILPRPYDDINTMANAKLMSIAWPYKKVIRLELASFYFTRVIIEM